MVRKISIFILVASRTVDNILAIKAIKEAVQTCRVGKTDRVQNMAQLRLLRMYKLLSWRNLPFLKIYSYTNLEKARPDSKRQHELLQKLNAHVKHDELKTQA